MQLVSGSSPIANANTIIFQLIKYIEAHISKCFEGILYKGKKEEIEIIISKGSTTIIKDSYQYVAF